jgi:hypothetical protein
MSPLRPRELFSPPWSGEGRFTALPWLQRLAPSRRLRFRTFTTWLTEELWLVHDQTVWENGRTERRDGVARLVAPDRIRLTYDDMLGGTEIRLQPTGYFLAPYLMLLPLPFLAIPVVARCFDRCELQADGSLVDTIDLAVVGIKVGRLVMHLRREEASAPASGY